MNLSEFNDDDDDYNYNYFYDNDNNSTFADTVSRLDVIANITRQRPARIDVLSDIVFYVVLTLGIPGNILSAIVWMRRHVSVENSSAVYLAALAINDLIYLLRIVVRRCVPYESDHFGWLWRVLGESARILEPLLVLSFSVERLFAILRPSQVSCVRFKCTFVNV